MQWQLCCANLFFMSPEQFGFWDTRICTDTDDMRNVSMNHDYETGVALSDSVNKTCVKRSLAEKSRIRHTRLAINPRYLGNHASQIKSYYRTLSGSHGRSFRIRHKKSPEAPLVEKSQWRHIRLANKLRCLGKHASQMKSYWRTQSGSHGRSFRIRHEKSPEAPLAEESWWRDILREIKAPNHAS